ncbi:MAG: hypothetical protein CMG62_11425 [Candidatus Marinimicrobia bacterium]|nr:hypothetical protein [Candidatus Neomarinimicrobiota bacterium]
MTSKTFAIITDIHSNIASLNKAISVIDNYNDNIDQVICLGDCFSLGPEPEKVLGSLQQLQDCIFVRGNHDRYLIEKLWEDELPSLEGMDPYDPITKSIVQNEKWTADKIGKAGIDFIKKMKIAYREIIGTTLVEFSHAWYQRDDKPPSTKEALNWRDNVIKQNPEIKNVVFVHGHVHVPRHQKVENLTILCQGATGLPFDRNKKGAVAFLSIKDEIKWDVIRYDYDFNSTMEKLEERQPPFYKNLRNTVKFASIRNDI